MKRKNSSPPSERISRKRKRIETSLQERKDVTSVSSTKSCSSIVQKHCFVRLTDVTELDPYKKFISSGNLSVHRKSDILKTIENSDLSPPRKYVKLEKPETSKKAVGLIPETTKWKREVVKSSRRNITHPENNECKKKLETSKESVGLIPETTRWKREVPVVKTSRRNITHPENKKKLETSKEAVGLIPETTRWKREVPVVKSLRRNMTHPENNECKGKLEISKEVVGLIPETTRWKREVVRSSRRNITHPENNECKKKLETSKEVVGLIPKTTRWKREVVKFSRMNITHSENNECKKELETSKEAVGLIPKTTRWKREVVRSSQRNITHSENNECKKKLETSKEAVGLIPETTRWKREVVKSSRRNITHPENNECKKKTEASNTSLSFGNCRDNARFKYSNHDIPSKNNIHHRDILTVAVERLDVNKLNVNFKNKLTEIGLNRISRKRSNVRRNIKPSVCKCAGEDIKGNNIKTKGKHIILRSRVVKTVGMRLRNIHVLKSKRKLDPMRSVINKKQQKINPKRSRPGLSKSEDLKTAKRNERSIKSNHMKSKMITRSPMKQKVIKSSIRDPKLLKRSIRKSLPVKLNQEDKHNTATKHVRRSLPVNKYNFSKSKVKTLPELSSPYSCSICSIEFPRQMDGKTHELTHSDKIPSVILQRCEVLYSKNSLGNKNVVNIKELIVNDTSVNTEKSPMEIGSEQTNSVNIASDVRNMAKHKLQECILSEKIGLGDKNVPHEDTVNHSEEPNGREKYMFRNNENVDSGCVNTYKVQIDKPKEDEKCLFEKYNGGNEEQKKISISSGSEICEADSVFTEEVNGIKNVQKGETPAKYSEKVENDQETRLNNVKLTDVCVKSETEDGRMEQVPQKKIQNVTQMDELRSQNADEEFGKQHSHRNEDHIHSEQTVDDEQGLCNASAIKNYVGTGAPKVTHTNDDRNEDLRSACTDVSLDNEIKNDIASERNDMEMEEKTPSEPAKVDIASERNDTEMEEKTPSEPAEVDIASERNDTEMEEKTPSEPAEVDIASEINDTEMEEKTPSEPAEVDIASEINYTEMEEKTPSEPAEVDIASERNDTEMEEKTPSEPAEVDIASERNDKEIEEKTPSEPAEVDIASERNDKEIEEKTPSEPAKVDIANERIDTEVEEKKPSEPAEVDIASERNDTEMEEKTPSEPAKVVIASERNDTEMEEKTPSEPAEIDIASERNDTEMEEKTPLEPAEVDIANERIDTEVEEKTPSEPAEVDTANERNYIEMEDKAPSEPAEVDIASERNYTEMEEKTPSEPAEVGIANERTDAEVGEKTPSEPVEVDIANERNDMEMEEKAPSEPNKIHISIGQTGITNDMCNESAEPILSEVTENSLQDMTSKSDDKILQTMNVESDISLVNIRDAANNNESIDQARKYVHSADSYDVNESEIEKDSNLANIIEKQRNVHRPTDIDESDGRTEDGLASVNEDQEVIHNDITDKIVNEFDHAKEHEGEKANIDGLNKEQKDVSYDKECLLHAPVLIENESNLADVIEKRDVGVDFTDKIDDCLIVNGKVSNSPELIPDKIVQTEITNNASERLQGIEDEKNYLPGIKSRGVFLLDVSCENGKNVTLEIENDTGTSDANLEIIHDDNEERSLADIIENQNADCKDVSDTRNIITGNNTEGDDSAGDNEEKSLADIIENQNADCKDVSHDIITCNNIKGDDSAGLIVSSTNKEDQKSIKNGESEIIHADVVETEEGKNCVTDVNKNHNPAQLGVSRVNDRMLQLTCIESDKNEDDEHMHTPSSENELILVEQHEKQIESSGEEYLKRSGIEVKEKDESDDTDPNLSVSFCFIENDSVINMETEECSETGNKSVPSASYYSEQCNDAEVFQMCEKSYGNISKIGISNDIMSKDNQALESDKNEDDEHMHVSSSENEVIYVKQFEKQVDNSSKECLKINGTEIKKRDESEGDTDPNFPVSDCFIENDSVINMETEECSETGSKSVPPTSYYSEQCNDSEVFKVCEESCSISKIGNYMSKDNHLSVTGFSFSSSGSESYETALSTTADIEHEHMELSLNFPLGESDNNLEWTTKDPLA